MEALQNVSCVKSALPTVPLALNKIAILGPKLESASPLVPLALNKVAILGPALSRTHQKPNNVTRTCL